MKRTVFFKIVALSAGAVVALSACERTAAEENTVPADMEIVSVDEVARILSAAALSPGQLDEVHDAVSGSIANGYDAEYTLRNLLASPGGAVGDDRLVRSRLTAPAEYADPLRNIFYRYFDSQTKAGADAAREEDTRDAARCLDYLMNSDIQIYMPEFEAWDGKTSPVIAVEPPAPSAVIKGYQRQTDGSLREIEVTEQTAMERPVWVINHNDDSSYQTLEVYRRNHPEWGEGGQITLRSPKAAAAGVRTLVLKDFTMKRNYDEWYRGASEFFVKIGSVESFVAATEAELRMFDPSITDFMVVVRRRMVNKTVPLNTVLVSEWTSQLEKVAFMITEDDGGTITNWNCSAVVKYNSKSYGFEIKIPYNSHDDIVWRGQLSRKYIEANNDITGYFGDVVLTFAIQ